MQGCILITHTCRRAGILILNQMGGGLPLSKTLQSPAQNEGLFVSGIKKT